MQNLSEMSFNGEGKQLDSQIAEFSTNATNLADAREADKRNHLETEKLFENSY